MHTNKFIIPKQISILLLLVVLLEIARILIFHSTYFVYLLWNIFLAMIPFIISSILLFYLNNKKLKIPMFIVGGILWLFFLPNAPYIVTDIIHIGRSHSAPILYDTFLVFSSAWLGLILGMYSLLHIETIIKSKLSDKMSSLIMVAIIFLTSFGVYLGRFLRFNSWDIFYDVSLLFNNILGITTKPTDHTDAYWFTMLSFVFIYLSYRAWKYNEYNGI